MDLRQTKEYGEYLAKCGWIILQLPINTNKHQWPIKIFIKKLPVIPFSVLKVQRFEEEIDWEELKKIKIKYKVIFTVIEPLKPIYRESPSADCIAGPATSWLPFKDSPCKLSRNPYLPMKTRVIDLKKSEEVLKKEVSKDVRQKIKSLKGRFVNYPDKDLYKFREEWKKCKRGFVPSLQTLINLKEAFGEKCWVMSAQTSIRERPSADCIAGPAYRPPFKDALSSVAGTVILLSDDTAYYYYAWTNKEGRKTGAQYGLVWEAILKAKKAGLKKFDFEGVYDSRWPIKSWRGFSDFKRKFGGEEVGYPGSWQRWF